MRQRDTGKRDAIFQATKELLNEIGFAEISMSKIAKRAGVSAATIYVYFDNKDDMLKKLYLDVKRSLATTVAGTLGEGLTIRQTVELCMRRYLAFILDNQEDYLFLEQFSNSPLLKNLCIDETEAPFQPLLDVLEKGKREGVLRPVEDKLLVSFCALPLEALVKDALRQERPITQEEIQTVLDMSWNAVKE